MIKFYYGPEAEVLELYRVAPAPQISINTQLTYANDVIIGYSYIISINGIVSTLNQEYIETLENDLIYEQETPSSGLLTTENEIVLIDESETILYQDDPNSIDRIRSIRTILNGIEYIRKLFSRNGSALTIRDDQNNNLLRAKGGILKNINFNNSQNQWTITCPYTIELEFNELEILDETILCSDSLIHDSSKTLGLVDITQYKIKNFSDSWSFNVEDSIYNHIYGNSLDVVNSEIAISYSLSATGKNYFIEDSLSPAWIQAKNFVQKRLYDQVRNLGTALTRSGDTCSANKTLAEIHTNDGSGVISGITTDYSIYNETLSCNTSESEGTFSVQYNAILKRNYDSNYCSSNIRHTFNKNITSSTNGNKNNISINIDGQIEGLCEGGILQNFGTFSFPQNGTILQTGSTSTKYANANAFLPKILNSAGDDLEDNFKSSLNITASELELPSSEECGVSLIPSNFSLTRNYMTGIISYTAQYSSDRACQQNPTEEGSVFKTSITVEEPIPIISEFTIPNGDYVIQDIGTYTARKINVTSEGKKTRSTCDTDDINAFLDEILNSDIETLFPFLEFPDEEIFVLTNKSFDYNILEGSFTVNLSYICDEGCNI